MPDPKPYKAIAGFNGKNSIMKSDSCRSVPADLLETS